jgi:signal transduction histidine kinase
VTLAGSPAQVTLEICDDGVGFDPSAPATDNTHHGLGLLGMRERMRMIGGELTIFTAPGQGTRILARAPLAQKV